MSALQEQEFCVSCGNMVDALLPNTGWCIECSGFEVGQLNSLVCVRCRRGFQSTIPEFICRSCKDQEWADEVEQLMVMGKLSYTRAKQLVAKNNQAVCLCCGEVMPRATKGRHLFCTNHRRCKSASRRVKHLRLGHGMSKQDALHKVLNEIQMEDDE